MSVSRLIKRRIKSAKNISQITKAMEMVSASKMRRSQDQVLSSRPYASKMQSMLRTIAANTDSSLHPFLQKKEGTKHLVVLISSDRGLVGSLNTNLLKATEEYAQHHDTDFIVVGKKGREYIHKTGRNITAEFTSMPERTTFEQTLPISELIMKAYLTGDYATVSLLHMKFISTLSQRVEVDQLLPFHRENLEPEVAISSFSEYTFEPNPKDILTDLLPYYIELLVYQTVLDAKASEHSARMVAMKNASDNAKDVVKDLQLTYNKSRQASITNELIEITTAALSVA